MVFTRISFVFAFVFVALSSWNVAIADPEEAKQAGRTYRIIDGFGPFYNPQKQPPNSWAMPYVHLDTKEAPYIDLEAAEHSCQQFDKFCQRVSQLGYTHAIIGNLIHCCEFKVEGRSLYSENSVYLARAKQYKVLFRRIRQIAKKYKMGLVLETDFPTWTPELRKWLGAGGLRVTNPKMAEAYTAAFEEAFSELDFDAISVRIGEGGGAYNEDSGYKSTVMVKTIKETQETLNFLVSIINKYNQKHNSDKKILFRTWTIGIGEIGALHTNAGIYERVFKPFYQEKHLITVMKHVAMDFFDYIPMNPTIGTGELPQIVEFQARREYEGFHLYPNYRAPSFKNDIQKVMAKKTVRGVSVWPTNGGFLQTATVGYFSGGVPAWIDINVFAYAKLIENPKLTPEEIASLWLSEQYQLSQADRKLAAEILTRSESRITRGMYLRPYAERIPSAFGLDYFPSMLWIYWTRPVAAVGVQSFVFRWAREDIPQALKDGDDCVNELQSEIQLAQKLEQSEFKDWLIASLEYQQNYYEVLRHYRHVFLNFHDFVDTGSAEALARSRAARSQLSQAMTDHRNQYGSDLQRPAMDLRELDRELRDLEQFDKLRWVAGILAVFVAALALLSFAAGPLKMTWLTQTTSLSLILPLATCFAPGLTIALFFHGFEVFSTFGFGFFVALLYLGSTWLVLSRFVTLDGEKQALHWTCDTLWGPLLSCAYVLAIIGWRSPAFFYQKLVGCIFADFSAILWISLTLLPVLASVALWFWAFYRESGLDLRRVIASFAVISLFHAAIFGGVGMSLTKKSALLKINEISRFAPSILDKAGTGVEELTGGGDH